MRLIKTSLLAIVFLFTVASCQKDEIENNHEANFEIDLTLASQNDEALAAEILVLLNDHRTSMGLSALAKGTQYSSAFAVEHTNYMIAKNQISHDNFPTRSAALESNGAQSVGENVAYGYTDAATVVSAWLNSESHRRNIEGNFTHAGFGVKKCTQSNTYYFTQLFYRN